MQRSARQSSASVCLDMWRPSRSVEADRGKQHGTPNRLLGSAKKIAPPGLSSWLPPSRPSPMFGRQGWCRPAQTAPGAAPGTSFATRRKQSQWLRSGSPVDLPPMLPRKGVHEVGVDCPVDKNLSAHRRHVRAMFKQQGKEKGAWGILVAACLFAVTCCSNSASDHAAVTKSDWQRNLWNWCPLCPTKCRALLEGICKFFLGRWHMLLQPVSKKCCVLGSCNDSRRPFLGFTEKNHCEVSSARYLILFIRSLRTTRSNIRGFETSSAVPSRWAWSSSHYQLYWG